MSQPARLGPVPAAARRAVGLALAALVAWASIAASAARQPDAPSEVWFFSSLKPDYTRLFEAPDEWAGGLAARPVIELPVFFVHLAEDSLIRRIVAFAKKHRLPLALEGIMLTPGPDGCGSGVEGYAAEGEMRAVATRLRDLGADIRFVAMDEPLWFGHVARSFWRPSKGVCRASLDTVASNLARVAAEVRSVFPEASIGDIEPIVPGDPAMAGYPDLLAAWTAAVERATGHPLAFVHFDIAWGPEAAFDPAEHRRWSAVLAASVARMRDVGVRVGIIYDGRDRDADDVSWVDHAAYRYETIEGTLGIVPDVALIATWMTHPDRVLPETRPGTMSDLLLRYTRWRRSREQPGAARAGTVRDP